MRIGENLKNEQEIIINYLKVMEVIEIEGIDNRGFSFNVVIRNKKLVMKEKIDKSVCTHPFNRLHWIDRIVYCNQCGSTLHSSNVDPIFYTEKEVYELLLKYIKDSSQGCIFYDDIDWWKENKKK